MDSLASVDAFVRQRWGRVDGNEMASVEGGVVQSVAEGKVQGDGGPGTRCSFSSTVIVQVILLLCSNPLVQE